MFTLDRLTATAAALLALAGVAVGLWSLANARRKGSVRAVIAGTLSTVVGVLVVATADGGPGTGNGVVGGWAALILGPMSIALGGLALARGRAQARPD
ncbi:hypothetical protein Aab01nite_49970 [Paractinoplanes abujensis]|uniref:Drug/metabolite transporter (DMT)-like permease n=1 Tax=Paractinoplanes abujensis TaxID=882441 RepID=A0A7W7G2L4_9ACTN|nr:DUF6223 family protein [Actinoplanes abujensis]MBB4693937.1 drug/metabolite transporter (DMT)-like permease [Actinoplanes abujensis]GID21407.1 hypothetical protein Aab01nite_49970 [Actinoplanes abujensis]